MKKIIIIMIAIVSLGLGWYLLSPLFINTEVHDEIPTDIIQGEDVVMNEPIMQMPEPTIEELDQFMGADNFHKASGKVVAISNLESQYLRFEDFMVTNGPDLKVLLSTEENPIETGELGEYIELADLKGNIGDQNYMLGGTDLTEYKSIVIYCKPFHVIFGSAGISFENI